MAIGPATEAILAETFARLDSSPADRELIDLARECLAAQPTNRPRDAGHALRRLTAFLRGVQDKLRKSELERAEAQA